MDMINDVFLFFSGSHFVSRKYLPGVCSEQMLLKRIQTIYKDYNLLIKYPLSRKILVALSVILDVSLNYILKQILC